MATKAGGYCWSQPVASLVIVQYHSRILNALKKAVDGDDRFQDTRAG